ncbi:spore germination protein [Paenibacillus arenilitoris]|uniref:Spore germination protein n=1 Tax=Paenibacillus arenilitoris TaxID=2772299 RepID=A0A927CN60_9BACL|nr:spore germination protein [Paenibacillus arenilitoris]MBD2870480.1 spore germination protein [Paenibacillus arenilitoris]
MSESTKSGIESGSDAVKALSADLDTNIKWLTGELGSEPDIVIRQLQVLRNKRAALVYISDISDNGLINSLVTSMLDESLKPDAGEFEEEPLQGLMLRSLSVGGIRKLDSLDHVLLAILEGCSVIMLDGFATAIAADTGGREKRGVEEPSSQTVVRGPKEGFTESVRTNTALIRAKIKSADLRMEYKLIGKRTRTTVVVVYMKGIADEQMIRDVSRRLDLIDTDSILESGYIEEFILGKTFTPFPLIQNTERPDAVAAGLLEGQFAIIVDGTPFVLLAPVTFVKFFQSSEDYYQRYDIASFLRLIRMSSFLVSMLFPSLYIAITTFHQEMLPTSLLISLAAQREGVPFPALIEAMIMELTFEILREAGVRMPRIIGSAISIVGALVLGQSAVQAGLVSAAMVIVVSFTAIASFVIPSVNMGSAARLIRFGMMFLAGSFGLFGIMAGLMVILAHMSGLRSFGVPYLTPLSPLVPGNLKDVFIRVPWWAMKKRPALFGKATARQGSAEPNAGNQGKSNGEGKGRR